MTDKERKKYMDKYRHLHLYFAHGRGWDRLTLIAAMELDFYWPNWMPSWLKRLNNRFLYANKGKSIVKVTNFYYSPLRRLLPFIQPYPRFNQIKEKYGGLRLYGADSLGSILEDVSYKICEDCGSTDDVSQTEGYVRTLCKKCKIKNNG